ncbi:hypothetical protein [Sporocytophaga myxococcoides]|uniref:hypothetical protein n=1 Tax=Sporocytophaga myxococcoides TaxID=153721 RepID=UPI0005ED8E3B|nr:hypothetical protein [Sporocytophaga myxococcoides]
MLIVIPSLIIVFMMLVIVYLVNFNKHKSKRDLRYTVTEKNLYNRRADELRKTGPEVREKPIYENKKRVREPVRNTNRRPRENFKKTSEDSERSEI